MGDNKILTLSGLGYFWNKVKNWVNGLTAQINEQVDEKINQAFADRSRNYPISLKVGEEIRYSRSGSILDYGYFYTETIWLHKGDVLTGPDNTWLIDTSGTGYTDYLSINYLPNTYTCNSNIARVCLITRWRDNLDLIAGRSEITGILRTTENPYLDNFISEASLAYANSNSNYDRIVDLETSNENKVHWIQTFEKDINSGTRTIGGSTFNYSTDYISLYNPGDILIANTYYPNSGDIYISHKNPSNSNISLSDLDLIGQQGYVVPKFENIYILVKSRKNIYDDKCKLVLYSICSRSDNDIMSLYDQQLLKNNVDIYDLTFDCNLISQANNIVFRTGISGVLFKYYNSDDPVPSGYIEYSDITNSYILTVSQDVVPDSNEKCACFKVGNKNPYNTAVYVLLIRKILDLEYLIQQLSNQINSQVNE